MIRQNRFVPILMVLTLAWVLYLGGCFGSEEAKTSLETVEPTVTIETPTAKPVVTENAQAALAQSEEPFVYTIEEGDLLSSIATKFNCTQDVIIRANPGLNPHVIIPGATIQVPCATTNNTIDEDLAAAREAGEPIDYVVESGDSLGVIAALWTVTTDALLEANPGIQPNALQIGDLLVVPPYGTGISAEQLEALKAPTCAEREPGTTLMHPVEPGDNLSALAAYYGVTIDELVAVNRLDDGNQLVVGQDLAIPPPSPNQESSC